MQYAYVSKLTQLLVSTVGGSKCVVDVLSKGVMKYSYSCQIKAKYYIVLYHIMASPLMALSHILLYRIISSGITSRCWWDLKSSTHPLWHLISFIHIWLCWLNRCESQSGNILKCNWTKMIQLHDIISPKSTANIFPMQHQSVRIASGNDHATRGEIDVVARNEQREWSLVVHSCRHPKPFNPQQSYTHAVTKQIQRGLPRNH